MCVSARCSARKAKRLLLIAALTAMSLTALLISAASADFRIVARSADDLDRVTRNLRDVVNENNIGDPTEPNNLPSTRAKPSHSQVLAAGETNARSALVDLPPGNYVVSLKADGFKIGGAFVTPGDTAATVYLAPYPLPLSNIEDIVFEDNQPVGIRIEHVLLTANGAMIDLRFRVLDPERASSLMKTGSKAALVDEATGKEIVIAVGTKIGALRQFSEQPERGSVYFMLFGNRGRLIEKRSEVSIVIGDSRTEHLVVKCDHQDAVVRSRTQHGVVQKTGRTGGYNGYIPFARYFHLLGLSDADRCTRRADRACERGQLGAPRERRQLLTGDQC